MCVTWKRHERLGIGNVTNHRLWRMASIVLTCLSLFYRLTWVHRCWPRATPDFGSVSVISSVLLQDIPRHPDTRLFEVQEAFKRSLLRFSGAYSRIYRNFFAARTDAEPSINALTHTLQNTTLHSTRSIYLYQVYCNILP